MDADFEEGKRYMGGAAPANRPPVVAPQFSKPDAEGYGLIQAIDPITGAKKWDYKMKDVTASGVLTTAGDLLFAGGRDGYFQALNARDGKVLWRVNAGGSTAMGPMTYQAILVSTRPDTPAAKSVSSGARSRFQILRSCRSPG